MAYTLTIKVAEQGARLSSGSFPYSKAGHIWYSISDGTRSYSYGYTSDGVVDTDDSLYLETYYTGQITITKKQFDILKNFGQKSVAEQYGFGDDNYNVLTNSCIDFTWKALNLAGFNPRDFQGALIPSANSWDLDKTLHLFLFGNTAYFDGSMANKRGYDAIFGSNSDDANLQSHNNTDRIFGGKGNDTIIGNNLNQHLYGGEDDDTIYAIGGNINYLYGEAGNDTLFGGSGSNDTLNGGLGYDIYHADNQDTIYDSDGQGRVYLNGTQLRGGKFDENLSSGNLEVYKSNDGFITYEYNTVSKDLKVNGLTINNFDNEELEINLTKELINEFAILSDTTGSMREEINSVKNQAIDIVNSAFRRDPNARIGVFGYNDPDVQTFSNLTNNQGAIISAINSLYANDGGDLEEMTYHGIYNAANANWSEHSVKRLFIFGDAPAKDTDFKETALAALRPNSSKTRDAFNSNDSDLSNIQVFAIQTGGGEEVAKEFREIAEFSGGAYINLATSGYESVADILFDMMNLGTNNSETIIGNDKNNTIDGKGGDDTLIGGIGSDTYIFGDNFGKDTIIETNSNNKDTNIIKFTNDTKLSDLTFTQNANDLIINHINKQDSITIKDFYTNETKISYLEFADGLKLNNTNLKDLAYLQENKSILHYANSNEAYLNTDLKSAFFMATSDTPSNISGGLLNDALIGSNKFDNINGGFGDDILVGLKGDDNLNGGKGNDKYIYHKGDGSDIIQDNGGSDTLVLRGISADQTKFTRSGNDLIIKFNENDDKITIKDHFKGLLKLSKIENIIFDKDENLSLADIDSFIANKYNKITYNDISNEFNSNIIENIAKPLNLPSQNTAKFSSNLDNESDFISDAQINKIIQDFYALNSDTDNFSGFSFSEIQNNSNSLQIYG